jgi:hypothetical protein
MNEAEREENRLWYSAYSSGWEAGKLHECGALLALAQIPGMTVQDIIRALRERNLDNLAAENQRLGLYD